MKEFDVNLTNMTYKDGLFNKKINAKPITFQTQSSNCFDEIFNRIINPVVEEGFVVCDFHKKAFVYRLSPQQLRIVSIEDKHKITNFWTKSCMILYDDDNWYFVTDDRYNIPFLFTNIFQGEDVIHINGMKFHVVRMCIGHTLANRSTTFQSIVTHAKEYIIAILQGQPNTDLWMRAPFSLRSSYNAEDHLIKKANLLKFIIFSYKKMEELQKDIKTKEEAAKWYAQNADALPRYLKTEYNKTVPEEYRVRVTSD